MTDDLIAFLNARLDEDEACAWKDLSCPQHAADRMLRKTAAERTIANDMAKTIGGEFIDEGERVVAAGVLRDLAAIYSDHPDYRPEWR